MTLRSNARIAGFAFWIYFAAGIGAMVLAGNAPAREVLSLLTSFRALVLGVAASALLVILLPLQVAGWFGGARAWSSPVTWAVWLPMLVFELTLAVWLITRGAAMPARQPIEELRS
ncbi:MAG: hypothetical protein ABI665_16150 [Vicinamibacterales bacterium]